MLQKEYDMVKNELKDIIERSNSYKNMQDSLAIEYNKENMEREINELKKQLEAYEAAYKNLEEKYKKLIQDAHSVNTKAKSTREAEIVDKAPSNNIESVNVEKRKEVIKKKEEPIKSQEQAEATIADLRKRITEDADAKQTLKEIIKLREDTIRKQKESIELANKRLEADKEEIPISKAQLISKNAEVKTLTIQINKILKELNKYKKPVEKKSNPRSLVKQRLKKEKPEPQPYLFGPSMDENNIDILNN